MSDKDYGSMLKKVDDLIALDPKSEDIRNYRSYIASLTMLQLAKPIGEPSEELPTTTQLSDPLKGAIACETVFQISHHRLN